MATTVSTTHPSLAAVNGSLAEQYAACCLGVWTSNGGVLENYFAGFANENAGYVDWYVRDNSYGMEGLKYFDTTKRLRTPVDALVAASPNVAIESLSKSLGLGSTCPMDCEADHEYTAIFFAYSAWTATGNDTWLATIMPTLDTWWQVAFTGSLRYDDTTTLPKRVHDIDIWDFDFLIRQNFSQMPANQRYWVVSTTDAACFYDAAGKMAEMYAHLGQTANATRYTGYRNAIKAAADTHLWDSTNSRWKLHKDLVLGEGTLATTYRGTWAHTDASRWGNFANAVAIIRGLSSPTQTAGAVAAFKAFRASYVDGTGSLNGPKIAYPWPLIYPPYPAGVYESGGFPSGGVATMDPYRYANGALAPFVGATWVHALFLAGEGALAWTLLTELLAVFRRGGQWSFYFDADGQFRSRWSDIYLRPNAWDTGTTIRAIVEGLAGITTVGPVFEQVACTPRWSSTGVAVGGHTFTGRAEFPAGNAYFEYALTYSADAKTATVVVGGTHSGGTLTVAGFPPATLTGGAQTVVLSNFTATPVNDHVALTWNDTVTGESAWVLERRVAS